MADAVLYYREGVDGSGDPDWGDADLTLTEFLNSSNSTIQSQRLEFTFSDNLVEAMQFAYRNNVIDYPVPISDGTRKINKQENGLREIKLILKGRFRQPQTSAGVPTVDSDIAKLIAMSKKMQVNTVYPYGIIGFYSPNAPEFSLDPNATKVGSTETPATKGYTIESCDLGFMTPRIKNYDFSVSLSFGGTW